MSHGHQHRSTAWEDSEVLGVEHSSDKVTSGCKQRLLFRFPTAQIQIQYSLKTDLEFMVMNYC